MIDHIQQAVDGNLFIFFIQPKLLWAGFLYTSYAKGVDVLQLGQVSYRLGYNLVKDNNLKERVLEDDPVKIVYNKKMTTGQNITASSGIVSANGTRVHKRILNHIPDVSTLQKLAIEKQLRFNYAGYEGNLDAFLQPYALPGYNAMIIDSRYPERNGLYAVESTSVYFGTQGASREVEIGAKLGFNTTT